MVQGTFTSYSLTHKGYKCLDPSGRVFISRDVIFDENIFPDSKSVSISHSTNSPIPLFSASPPTLSAISLSSSVEENNESHNVDCLDPNNTNQEVCSSPVLVSKSTGSSQAADQNIL